jgi:hypothetical protein
VNWGGFYARSDFKVADWRLHPLIHTLLKFNLAQDVGVRQGFSGFGNLLPQTGHTFSVGFTLEVDDLSDLCSFDLRNHLLLRAF